MTWIAQTGTIWIIAIDRHARIDGASDWQNGAHFFDELLKQIEVEVSPQNGNSDST